MKLFGGLTGIQNFAAWAGAAGIAYLWFSRPAAPTVLTTAQLESANEKKKASLDAKGLK